MSGDDVPGVDVAETGIEAAVDAVVAADGSRDRTLVRDALERVTADGVVTWDAVDDALAVVAQAASTAEEHTRMASFELTKARDDAESVADLPTVGARLDDIERELSVLRDRASDLDDRVDALFECVEEGDALYPLAVELRDAADEAESIEDTAMTLLETVDEFRDDLEDPESWVRNVRRDLVAVEDTLDAVENATEGLEAAVDDGEWTADVDPAVAWFDARLRAGVVALMVEDARFELDDLRAWADRADADWYPDDVADQVSTVEERQNALVARLDDLASTDWRERFADDLGAFEREMTETEPPVDWRELQATLERYRPEGARA